MALVGPVFVMTRSARGVSVSASVLLAELGSEAPAPGATVAVLTRTPTASGATAADAVKVAVAPRGRLMVSLMEPLPAGALQLPPSDAAHVHVTPVSAAGKTSVTVAPIASLGPLLVTTIV